MGEATDGQPPRGSAAPLRLGALFDIALRILRRHVVTLLLVAAAFQLPGAVLTAFVATSFRETLSDVVPLGPAGSLPAGLELTPDEALRLAGSAGLVLLVTAVAGVIASLGTLAFAHVVRADRAGKRAGFLASVRLALGRSPVALGVILVTTLVTVALAAAAAVASVLVLSILPAGPGGGPGAFVVILVAVAAIFAIMWLSLRWAMAFPVAALEDRGVVETLRRSWHLTSGQLLRTLAVLVTAAVVTAVLTAVVAQLLGIVLVDPLAGDPGQGWLAETAVAAIAQIALAPVAPVLLVVLYHDLLVRHQPPELRPPAPG
jgi:hypothetical protein